MQLTYRDTVFNDNGSWFTSDTMVHVRQYKEVIAHDLVKLKPTLDPDGTGMLYWYISISGDTVALSHELTTFEYQLPKMIQPIRASDTILPNGNQHPSVTAFVPHYPIHKHAESISTDSVFHAAMVPVLVLITLAYLVRSINKGCWRRLVEDMA